MEHGIFISYSREDEKQALHLLSVLRREGFTVWIDQEAIAGASIWSDEIVQNIKESQLFIALLSASSVASANVAKEIAIAAEHGKIILPVEIGSVELPGRLEYALAGIQRTSFQDEEAIIHAVSNQIERLATGAVPATQLHGHGHRPRKRRRQQRMIYASALLFVIALGLFIGLRPRTVPLSEIASNSVAVLPFATLNMDHDSTRNMDIFSDELISRLSANPKFKTASASVSTPYRNSRLNPSAIGAEEGERFIVDGIVRKSADVYHISVHIYDTKKGGEIWENNFSGNNHVLFPIREQICNQVDGQLNEVLGAEANYRAAEANLKAHPNDAEAFARLSHEVTGNDKLRAFELINEAIKRDSNNVRYYLNAGILAERANGDPKVYGRAALPLVKAQLLHDPNNNDLSINYVIALDLAGESERAGEIYDSLLKIRPTDVRLLYNASCCFARLAKTDHALDLLDRLLTLAPNRRGEVKYDPDFDNIRSNPHYLDLVYGFGQ